MTNKKSIPRNLEPKIHFHLLCGFWGWPGKISMSRRFHAIFLFRFYDSYFVNIKSEKRKLKWKLLKAGPGIDNRISSPKPELIFHHF